MGELFLLGHQIMSNLLTNEFCLASPFFQSKNKKQGKYTRTLRTKVRVNKPSPKEKIEQKGRKGKAFFLNFLLQLAKALCLAFMTRELTELRCTMTRKSE